MMQIQIGDHTEYYKTITSDEVVQFGSLLGDADSFHLNPEKAGDTVFGKPVVYGMQVAGYISYVLGKQLPGEGTIYLEQKVCFKRPVYVNDTIRVSATVTDILNPDKGVFRLDTLVTNQNGDPVVDGYAVVMNRRIAETGLLHESFN